MIKILWRCLLPGQIALLIAATYLAYTGQVPAGWFGPPYDKAGHFLLFGMLAFSLRPWLAPRWQFLAFLAPLALGLADEAMQSLSPARSADVLDFAADAAGIFCVRLLPTPSPVRSASSPDGAPRS